MIQDTRAGPESSPETRPVLGAQTARTEPFRLCAKLLAWSRALPVRNEPLWHLHLFTSENLVDLHQKGGL